MNTKAASIKHRIKIELELTPCVLFDDPHFLWRKSSCPHFFTARLLKKLTRAEQWDWSFLRCDIKESSANRWEEKPPRAHSLHGCSACDEPHPYWPTPILTRTCRGARPKSNTNKTPPSVCFCVLRAVHVGPNTLQPQVAAWVVKWAQTNKHADVVRQNGENLCVVSSWENAFSWQKWWFSSKPAHPHPPLSKDT